MASLSEKIKQKTESLVLSHEQYSIYEQTLNQKFSSIFERMREVVRDKRVEYMGYLTI